MVANRIFCQILTIITRCPYFQGSGDNFIYGQLSNMPSHQSTKSGVWDLEDTNGGNGHSLCLIWLKWLKGEEFLSLGKRIAPTNIWVV